MYLLVAACNDGLTRPQAVDHVANDAPCEVGNICTYWAPRGGVLGSAVPPVVPTSSPWEETGIDVSSKYVAWVDANSEPGRPVVVSAMIHGAVIEDHSVVVGIGPESEASDIVWPLSFIEPLYDAVVTHQGERLLLLTPDLLEVDWILRAAPPRLSHLGSGALMLGARSLRSTRASMAHHE
jgi:hypothetical protein